MSRIYTKYQMFLESQKHAQKISDIKRKIDGLSGKRGDIAEGIKIYRQLKNLQKLNEGVVNEGVFDYLRDKMSGLYNKMFAGKSAMDLSQDPKALEEAKQAANAIKQEAAEKGIVLNKRTLLEKINEFVRDKVMPIGFAVIIFIMALTKGFGNPTPKDVQQAEDEIRTEMTVKADVAGGFQFTGGGDDPVGSLKKYYDPEYSDDAETQQKDRVKDLDKNCNDTHSSRYQFSNKPLVKSAGGSDEVILDVPSWFDSDSPVLYDGIDLTEVSNLPAGEVNMFLTVDHNFTDAEWKVLSKYFDLKNNPNALKLEGGKLVFQNPFDNPDFKADYAKLGSNHHAVVKLHISVGTGGGQHSAPDVNVHGGTEDGLVKVVQLTPNKVIGGVRN